MKPFQYQRAGDVAAAVRVVANNPNAAYLAGGTNLVDLMKRTASNSWTMVPSA